MTKGKVMGADQVRYGGSRMMAHELYAESKCALCGKTFLRTGEHVYRREDRGTKWYCSYTCFRVKAREDEAKAREKFERSVQAIYSREKREAEYRERKKASKASKDEQVICKSLADAQVKLEEAEQKIKLYGNMYLEAEPGTHEQTQARRNLTRWERKRKYLREEVKHFEKKEQEA